MTSTREELFKKWENKINDLQNINPFQNATVLSDLEYKDKMKRIDWLIEELPSLLYETKEYLTNISLKGENRDLVEYALKLKTAANNVAEIGDITEEKYIMSAYKNVCKYINKEIDDLSKSDLDYYKRLMGKPYSKYAKIMLIDEIPLSALHGDNLNDIKYKALIKEMFSLLKPLLINGEINEFIINSDLGLSLITLIVLNLFRKDGYDVKVTLINKRSQNNVTKQQKDFFKKLSHLVTRIEHSESNINYGSVLSYRKDELVVM